MKIQVHTEPDYTVTVEPGSLNRIGAQAAKLLRPNAKVLIVSDSNVFPLYGGQVKASLAEQGLAVSEFIFSAGEQSKTLQTVSAIYAALAQNGFTRTDVVLNLGGGVAGDMGGFAAATFLRGIPYIQVPTTLLSQVDASVGGKTGVDLPSGKNLVGAFYQPRAVVIDPDTLKTLPKRQVNDGMGEVVKYGCIRDRALFARLQGQTKSGVTQEVIAACVTAKVDFVEADTLDTGSRMMLNFGHTLGHALEKLEGFTGLMHGEAVGIGMVLAAQIGERLGLTAAGTADSIRSLLKQYDLPVAQSFTAQQLVEATALDKKSDGDRLNLILLKEIGEAFIYTTDRAALLAVLKEIVE